MSDDKNISRLISESLHHKLDAPEAQQVAEHLAKDENSQDYEKLSRLIQDSVGYGARQAVSPSDSGPAEHAGLSKQAKTRMRKSVADAAIEKQKLSTAGLIRSAGSGVVAPATSSPDAGTRVAGEQRKGVSRFKIIRKLGEGGLGSVWLAQDEKLNRKVAIKELKRDSLESEAAWHRFQREAEITGRLEHPNIVPLYQYGDDRDSGEPFYVMRFVGKRTLADAIVEHQDRVEAGQVDGALSIHRLLTVFLDVCQAIAYAHSRGVVHRDIKPENIALDNFGQVVVLDWGLAKLMEDGELMQQASVSGGMNDSTFLQTLAGDALGTPLYMAPEQALGEHDKVNHQTDVYGLGAVLFAMLTGRAPHEQTTTTMTGKGLDELLAAIAESESPNIHEIKADVPQELAAICCKAMSKKMHLRYNSVEELAGELERWMAGQSEKQSRYEQLRMEGRELRADLQSFVNDAERNVQFMSHLPPIQEIIAAESDEEMATWRERLTTIFRGLLEANPDYGSVIYNRVDGDRFTELVRVERHSKERSSIRSVPLSRLRSDVTNDYISQLSIEKPEEVIVSLVCDPTCDKSGGTDSTVGLVAGIPIYDDRTEEPFGVVIIGCDIDRLLVRQLSRQGTSASEVIAACDIFHVMARSSQGRLEKTNNEKVADTAPHFLPAVEVLQNEDEYIDETNSDIYGARIWFIPRKHGLMYLLKK